jgi:transcription initiation factor TFIIH subunit 2
MADSDGEYIQDISDDEIGAHQVTSGARPGTRSTGLRSRGAHQAAQQTWEVRRTWENVVEGADGTISSTVEGLLEAGKRKRSVSPGADVRKQMVRSKGTPMAEMG